MAKSRHLSLSIKQLKYPLLFLLIIWGVFLFESIFHIELAVFGIAPQSKSGLIGILLAPVLHGDFNHLLSNSLSFFFLGISLYALFPRRASMVFWGCYLITGLLVWFFAPSGTYHIGASGLIYGIAFFMMFYGIFKRDFKSIVVSVACILYYGGIFWGIFPGQAGISWQSHLFGALVGIVLAFLLGRSK